eukprot:TRINITY_DN10833_c0_g1_i2.p1 TRINITY_DN10833_c0_g1~~TRINITY_DN10833_c0_g1_i2.p1  ORF type:complete len:250 (-),score=34.27 TRINITY_DN10833_c0_g1_i2:157-849(-)
MTSGAAASSCPLGFGGNTSRPPADSASVSAPSTASPKECPLGHSSAPPAAPQTGVPPTASDAKPAVEALSRKREESTIPSATGDPFMYPSERQFFGAATAKGHSIDPNDMSMVVAIHNAVNERTWQDILRYERLHANDCAVPKLERFIGRPGDLSTKAWLLGFTGRTAPFDRHDWHVDRCGTPVRYVVDFYDGKPSPTHPVSIHIDARPELSVGGCIDRLRMWAKDLHIF